MNESIAVITLRTFRHALYGCFERWADALMELTDALLTAGSVLSPAHLSLEAVHRRGWGSLYGALAQGRVNDTALRVRDLLSRYPLADDQPIYAVDCSAWARCAATISPERGYYHHASRYSGGVPVVAGWSYHWISFRRTGGPRRWTCSASPAAPTSIPPPSRSRPCSRGWPLTGRGRSLSSLPLRPSAVSARPGRGLGGHGGTLAQGSLLLGRSDRATVAPTGRPPRHGHTCDCTAPDTWLSPTAELRTEDPQYGSVRVRAWAGLHRKQQNHAARGTRKTRPVVCGTLILVDVSRGPGPPPPPLAAAVVVVGGPA